MRLAGVLHLLVLACLAAYVVLLPLLSSRTSSGSRADARPVRGPWARPRHGRSGSGPTRSPAP